MAENATLEFLGARMARLIADQAAMRGDIRVLTATARRHENTLKSMAEQMRDMLGHIRAMVAQHQRFNDRLRGLRTSPPDGGAAQCARAMHSASSSPARSPRGMSVRLRPAGTFPGYPPGRLPRLAPARNGSRTSRCYP
jgi:hypothetical protein